MKLSTLIKKLITTWKNHGDCEVLILAEPFNKITEIVYRDQYYDETAFGNDLPKGKFVVIEHEPKE